MQEFFSGKRGSRRFSSAILDRGRRPRGDNNEPSPLLQRVRCRDPVLVFLESIEVSAMMNVTVTLDSDDDTRGRRLRRPMGWLRGSKGASRGAVPLQDGGGVLSVISAFEDDFAPKVNDSFSVWARSAPELEELQSKFTELVFRKAQNPYPAHRGHLYQACTQALVPSRQLLLAQQEDHRHARSGSYRPDSTLTTSATAAAVGWEDWQVAPPPQCDVCGLYLFGQLFPGYRCLTCLKFYHEYCFINGKPNPLFEDAGEPHLHWHQSGIDHHY